MNSSSRKLGIDVKLMSIIIIITLVTLAIVVAGSLVLNGQEDDSTIINISGRQRMLSQKMSKEALAIAGGIKVAANKEALGKTFALFRSSHEGLLNGNEKMGVPPTTHPVIRKQMLHVDQLWKDFSPQVQIVLNSNADSDAVKQAVAKIMATNVTLLVEMNKAVGLYESTAKGKVHQLYYLFLAGAIIAVLAAIACWFSIRKMIIRPIRRISETMMKIEKGHAVEKLQMDRGDEIGMVAASVDALMESLLGEILSALNDLAAGDLTFDVNPRDADDRPRNALKKLAIDLNALVCELQGAGKEVAAGSEQVSHTSQDLSHRASNTAASLEELNSSMTEMISRTQQNADKAKTAQQQAKAAESAAQSGNDQVNSMVDTMQDINDAGKGIKRIISVIEEIAFQTNLLALNAAVEAARAGQHGKGFSVVAEEVRNLAARSAKAAQETAELIEATVGKTESGMEQVELTAEWFQKIVTGINETTELITSIAEASKDQANSLTMISQGLTKIDEITQQNTASSEETAATAEELFAQSEQMDALLQRFKVRCDIDSARSTRSKLQQLSM